MPTQEITKDTFNNTINNNDIVLVDWWAAWCGPCRSFAPVFEEASGRHTDIVFGKIDTEAQPELAAMARITSIPLVTLWARTKQADHRACNIRLTALAGRAKEHGARVFLAQDAC